MLLQHEAMVGIYFCREATIYLYRAMGEQATEFYWDPEDTFLKN